MRETAPARLWPQLLAAGCAAGCGGAEMARHDTAEWRACPAVQKSKNKPAHERDRDQDADDVEARGEDQRAGRSLVGLDADHEAEQAEGDGGRDDGFL